MINELRRCRPCGGWKTCPGKPFFKPSDIYQYCHFQVLWLVSAFFHAGPEGINWQYNGWPSWSEVSGYTSAPLTQHSISARANFVIPAENEVILSELFNRLQRTGKDGKLLVLELNVQNAYDTTKRDLSKDARNALFYVCGKRPQRRPFSVWLAQRAERAREKAIENIACKKVLTGNRS